VPLAWIDEKHFASRDFSLVGSVVEVQMADRNDQRYRDCIAMLWNILSGLQSQADHAHRSAVCDLLEAKGAPRSFRALR